MKQQYIIHTFEVAENGMRIGATEITDIVSCNNDKEASELGKLLNKFHTEHDNKEYTTSVINNTGEFVEQLI